MPRAFGRQRVFSQLSGTSSIFMWCPFEIDAYIQLPRRDIGEPDISPNAHGRVVLGYIDPIADEGGFYEYDGEYD